MPYTAPTFLSEAFNCPHCGAFAHQRWEGRDWLMRGIGEDIYTSTCAHCRKSAVWVLKSMVYPDSTNAPPPNVDLPEEVKKIYFEAASISSRSARSAAGPLRLAIQMLCKDLGESESNLNQAIGNLVQKGLPERIQKSLDVVRVTGNNALHPGQIDVDSPEVVSQLFTIVNLIGEYMISMPKKISNMYESLPRGALDQIEKRDHPNG